MTGRAVALLLGWFVTVALLGALAVAGWTRPGGGEPKATMETVSPAAVLEVRKRIGYTNLHVAYIRPNALGVGPDGRTTVNLTVRVREQAAPAVQVRATMVYGWYVAALEPLRTAG